MPGPSSSIIITIVLFSFFAKKLIFLPYFNALSKILLKHLINKFFLPLKFIFSSISTFIRSLLYFFSKDKIVFDRSNNSFFSDEVELANFKYSFNIFSISSISSDNLLEILLSFINANCSFILVNGVLKS